MFPLSFVGWVYDLRARDGLLFGGKVWAGTWFVFQNVIFYQFIGTICFMCNKRILLVHFVRLDGRNELIEMKINLARLEASLKILTGG